MLKNISITLTLVATSVSLLAQGTVEFDMKKADMAQDPVNGTTDTRVRNTDGTTLLTGTGFWAQLYAAPGTTATRAELQPVGSPVNFRGGTSVGWNQISGTTANGTVVNPIVIVTPILGGPASITYRAWQGGPGSTWETATIRGESPTILRLSSTGGGGSPPATPPLLFGMQGFAPEPSTITLGILGGLGTLVLLRRRK
jgi:hypothetical protein